MNNFSHSPDFCTDDLLLIVRGNKLSKAQENAAWFTALANRSVQVTCQTPEQAQLPAGLLRAQNSST